MDTIFRKYLESRKKKFAKKKINFPKKNLPLKLKILTLLNTEFSTYIFFVPIWWKFHRRLFICDSKHFLNFLSISKNFSFEKLWEKNSTAYFGQIL